MAPLIWSFVLATTLLGFGHAAQDDTCYGAPAPCVCEGVIIDCSYKNFNTIPKLEDGAHRYEILNLDGNNLGQVQARMFENITVHTITLNNCNLRHIDDNAFGGLEQHLTNLSLRGNHLALDGRGLPTALVHLRNLKYLDVSGNGFTERDYNDHVMRSIGASLTTFIFGDGALMQWPASLHHLQQLVNLDVEGGFLPIIPPGAFHGFEVTIKNLTFNNLTTYTVPLAIASLRNLNELHLDNLQGFGDASLTDQPFEGVKKTLTILSLKNDRLSVFPPVIRHLDNLKELTLDENTLDFISDESIALLQQRNVTFLSLKTCGLSRVPGAISNIMGLKTLHLSNNKITSIEQNEVQNMTNLNYLSFAGNPLEYVSNMSFIGLGTLQTLDLSYTHLTAISQAISHLRSLETLDLTRNFIDCTCDLVWLKRFLVCNKLTINIKGECETIDIGILDYINSFIPNCLAYNESTC